MPREGARPRDVRVSGRAESPAEACDLLFFERIAREAGALRVAGLDEAGRGPLAGPVVAAAVVLPARCESSRSGRRSPRGRSGN